ncbi:hypothetical protein BJF83_21390 [Nocardiopsis sp. CNR-923]|uniref:hypothetical protein n=1 Tax=Nocardiopsis sp. CNR-923 TaxID=1904965 RepID=UPI000967587A|nr:hypothetical protein [Nocardiopsis sp. CNR-923]OLT26357.1 hypothetical protein BJF83_21390 [Nocardiopsis sp. CNR-923]
MSGPLQGLHLRQVRTLDLRHGTEVRDQVWLADEQLGTLERGGCSCLCDYFPGCRLVFHGDTIALHQRWMELVEAERPSDGGDPDTTEEQMCRRLLRDHERSEPGT